MCTTTSHWETHISTECSLGGNGQCDGICYEHDTECTCGCHTAFDLPETVPAVLDWHDQYNYVVYSVAGTNSFAQAAAIEQAKVLINQARGRGEYDEYAVRTGQDRTVVAINP